MRSPIRRPCLWSDASDASPSPTKEERTMMSPSSAGPRRMLILMIAVTIGTGFVVCRQLWSLAAPGQRPQTKARTIYLDDTHLIRENEEARRLRQQVDLARKTAFEHGSHACCIGPPCSWCLLHLGQCT